MLEGIHEPRMNVECALRTISLRDVEEEFAQVPLGRLREAVGAGHSGKPSSRARRRFMAEGPSVTWPRSTSSRAVSIRRCTW